MLDLKLRLSHFDLALVEPLGDFALLRGEILHLAIFERPHGDYRQTRVDLTRSDRGLTREGTPS